jgi:probable F420-dependent oxidoreductase
MRKMPKLAVLLNELDTLIKPEEERVVLRFAREVEDAGYDGVLTAEHIALGPNSAFRGPPSNPREFLVPGNQDPRQHWPNPFIKLAAMAAVTERVRLMACATLTPLRHPLLNAKELATLDQLSGGRLVIAPICGWNRDEYDALGVPWSERGARLDEHLAILELVSRRSPATYHGRFYDFTDVYIEPKPVQPGGITIWAGGDRMTKKVVERIVRFGRGHCLIYQPTTEEKAHLQAEMLKAGRSVAELEYVGTVYPTFHDPRQVADLGQAIESSVVPQLENGANVLVVKPSQFIDDPREMPAFLKSFYRAVERVAA